MKHVRAVLRLLILAAWTLFASLLHVLARILALRFPRPAVRLQGWAFCTWAKGVCRLLGAKVEVEGDAPEAPFVLVCNHLGYFDVVVLATQVHCFFVAKAELARWPILGQLAGLAHTVFVPRHRRGDLPRVVEAIRRTARGGFGVVFFPEGTSTKGETVLPFKSSLFEAALHMECPVSCASLSYATPPGEPPAHRAVCWWGDMEFVPHLYEMLQLRSFSARLVFHPQRFAPTGRKDLARAAHEVVQAGFVPVVS